MICVCAVSKPSSKQSASKSFTLKILSLTHLYTLSSNVSVCFLHTLTGVIQMHKSWYIARLCTLRSFSGCCLFLGTNFVRNRFVLFSFLEKCRLLLTQQLDLSLAWLDLYRTMQRAALHSFTLCSFWTFCTSIQIVFAFVSSLWVRLTEFLTWQLWESHIHISFFTTKTKCVHTHTHSQTPNGIICFFFSFLFSKQMALILVKTENLKSN